jgi:hypothetical protein
MQSRGFIPQTVRAACMQARYAGQCMPIHGSGAKSLIEHLI